MFLLDLKHLFELFLHIIDFNVDFIAPLSDLLRLYCLRLFKLHFLFFFENTLMLLQLLVEHIFQQSRSDLLFLLKFFLG